MSIVVPVERPPDALAGRAPMNISRYTGRDWWLSLLPSGWQARLCVPAARKVYRARGFPPQGIAMQLPNGDWYGLDAPDGQRVWRAR